MADVLVVHDEEDQDAAATLARELRANGWSTWLGDFSPSMIEAVLPRTRCVVVLWSSTALSTERIAFFTRHAQRHPFLSVLIDAIPVPSSLRIDLSLLQWSEDRSALARLWSATTSALAHKLPLRPKPAQSRAAETARPETEPPISPPTSLTLEIVNANADWVGQNRRKIIGRTGARIGRSRECDWVIKSPYLSRIHARIRVIDNRYFIEGTGRTPLRLNARQLPNHLLWELHAGDRLLLDEYEIKIALQRTPPGAERLNESLDTLQMLGRKPVSAFPTQSDLTIDGDSPEWRIPAGG